MKRVLFSLLAMFAVGSLWAQSEVTETDLSEYDDVLYAKSITVMQGTEEVILPIWSKTHKGFTGVSLYVVMPKDSKVLRAVSLSPDAYNSNKEEVEIQLESWAGNEQADKSYMVIGALASTDPSTADNEKLGFYAGDHELGTLKIDVSQLKAGEYPIIIRQGRISGFLNGDPDVEISDDIVSKLIITDRITLDENETEVPAAMTGVDVLVKRTIKAGEWSTICLPFAMTEAQVKAAFGNGVQLAEFSGSDVYFDGSSVANIRINFITEGVSTIEANHPYVIKSERNIPNEDEEEFKEGFRVDEVSIVDGTPTIKKSATWHIQGMDISGGSDEFIGSYVVTEIPVNSLFLSGSTYYYATAATKKMKGFRAYFTLTKELDDKSASSAKIGFFIDDETTAIDGINAGQRVIDGVYDLQGRKVMVKDGDINNLQRGIYIINGKKVAIK